MIIKFYTIPLLMLILAFCLGCSHKNVVLYQSSDSRARLTSYGDRSSSDPQKKRVYPVNLQSFSYGFGKALSEGSTSPLPFLTVGGTGYSATSSGFLNKEQELQITEAALLPSMQAPYARYTIRPKKPTPLDELLPTMLNNYRDLAFMVISADVQTKQGESIPVLITLLALRDEELLNQPKFPLFNQRDIPGDNKPILRGVVCRLTDSGGLDLLMPESLDLRLSKMEEFSPDLPIIQGDLHLYLLKDIENR
ncbi:MAG: hypothetical protein ACFCU1_02380 [Sumerlaeia bacterium]